MRHAQTANKNADGCIVKEDKNFEKKAIMDLSWALERLAYLQGVGIDTVNIENFEAAILRFNNYKNQLKYVCNKLDFPRPFYPRKLDRAQLPLICYTREHGWCVVVDQNPDGQWVMIKKDETITVNENYISGSLASIKLNSDTSLIINEWMKPKNPKRFINHLNSALFTYKNEIIESAFASLFMGILAMAISLFSMQVYDRVIPIRSEHTLIVLSGGVVITIFVELWLKFIRAKLMEIVISGVDQKLSRKIYERLLSLRFDQIPTSVGSLAGQLRGYEQVRNFYTATTLFTLVDLPLAAFFIIIVAYIATPMLALIPFIAVMIVFIIGIYGRKIIKNQTHKAAEYSNLKIGLLVETVEGFETIKAGSGGWKFLNRWIDINNVTIKNDLNLRHAHEGALYWISAIQQISYVGLIAAGALLVIHGELTIGGLIACSILSGRILAPVMALPNLMTQHAHAQAALTGIEHLFKLKTEQNNDEQPLIPDKINGLYKINNIKFNYSGESNFIKISNLTIKPGERISILGPIGSGKSTFLRLLSGLYEPTEGKILLDDLNLAQIQRQTLNRYIGYLQQDHRLFQGTLRENLLIGLPDPGDSVIFEVLKKTGMDKFVSSHPKGLSRKISEGGKGLSGGQKQLLAFTRLILCDPQIYILDEPTAAMDEEQERRCLDVLWSEAQKGKTLIIVTHKPILLALVNRIIVISESKIVLDGNRDAIINKLKNKKEIEAS